MIRVERHGAVAEIVIDYPERRNALNDEQEIELSSRIREQCADSEVRALVVTGTGSSFCSGADLRTRLPQFQVRVAAGEAPPWTFGGITGSKRPEKPIIAAVNGYAIGGGMELALASDIRICSSTATFAMAEVKWGVTPGAGGTQRLARVVGYGAALDLLLTARSVSADEALRIGLVTQVVDPADLRTVGLDIATVVANNGPLAVASVRASVDEGWGRSVHDALAIERDAFIATLRSADAREGSTAFAEKRQPIFTGE